MQQGKFKQVMEEAIKSSWIYKLFKWFSKNKEKDLCSRCKKNKAEAVIKGNQLCLECISHYNKKEKPQENNSVWDNVEVEKI